MKRAISIVLCLLGIGLVVVLSGSLSRAAAPASWKAVILPGGNLLGDALHSDGSGWVYDDAENSVDVYATIGTMGKLYRTIFHMNVYYPAKVEFSGTDFIPVSSGSDATLPGFPTGQLYEFINNQHPYDDQYLAITFGFFGEYTTNKALADWTKMEIGGAKIPMRMYISIAPKSLQGDCSECIPDNYHGIEINSFDAELGRTGTNDWTIHVDADFAQIPPESLTYPAAYSSYEFIAEKYCTCVTSTVRKKTISTKVINYAAWGTGHMLFDIKFVTN
jgi:hypothetical protein